MNLQILVIRFTNFSYHVDCREALWMIRTFSRRLWNTLHLLMNILRISGRKGSESDGESKEEKYKINALHKKIDSDEMAEIPLGAESAGTLKMFCSLSGITGGIRKGSVFFIWWIKCPSASAIGKKLLLTFLNPNINVNHAQLVFTNAWYLATFKSSLCVVMKSGLLRRMTRGVSTLYSLADFVDEDGARIQRTKAMRRIHLIGKYGAIPTLKSIDMFKEDWAWQKGIE